MFRRAWVGVGGNVGDVAYTFKRAVQQLARLPGLEVMAVSSTYCTPAWGGVEQSDYLNAVAQIQTELEPEALLAHLLAIERLHGRDRAQETRWGPRTLDLDLLAMEGVVCASAELELPHPRLAGRAFVLVPWAELAPDFEVPGVGKVANLRDSLDCSSVVALP